MSKFARRCVIAYGSDNALDAARTHILTQSNATCLFCAAQLDRSLPDNVHFYPFNQSRNVLGQEFDMAILDFAPQHTLHFHLDSLAIVSACIKAGGTLLILLPAWATLAEMPDHDSSRWNNQCTIATPHFIHFFQTSVADYDWQVLDLDTNTLPRLTASHGVPPPEAAIRDQRNVLAQLKQDKTPITLITAARGRGKSALLGQLITQLGESVVVSAVNKRAVTTLYRFTTQKPHFIAPDALLEQYKKSAEPPLNWLIIDEAAMLPMAMLEQLVFCAKQCVLATTLDGYEGTGQGFSIKFMQRFPLAQHIQLHTPLRWIENDPLERWVNEMLLGGHASRESHSAIGVGVAHSMVEKIACYQLLRLAHYRTTPLDVRRIMDATGQRLYQYQQDNRCVGALWAVNEGGLPSALVQAIYRGERQPAGNLVAQMLCFQAALPEGAKLMSVRISRIAVCEQYRQRGFARALIVALHTMSVDFLSVSFGYTPELATFWQKCSFEVVHITRFKEASSGLFSAVALCGLSQAGQIFVQKAKVRFMRDFPLTEHPLLFHFSLPQNWALTDDDRRMLWDFVQTNRTFYAILPALKRYLNAFPDQALAAALRNIQQATHHQKAALKQLKVRLLHCLQA
ncbi:GNAT family N-acetyltransferase [Spirabiliibacterium falconis]|uniref:GNAT family N-acetyltransferase n=1 Tax=Spirabiliibacterium falconis TaxID=572023 RepID=UPI001AADA755|nr:GNAT family N-acetyltransferase [Spirabiliibacterium falconis]MBE2894998.1 tRNA(Met) cytidine acetyltransferase [Spirabiliibacterium falconis]